MLILIGGNGFLGRHIAAAAQGDLDLLLVASRRDDAFIDAHAPAAAYCSIADFAAEPGDEWLRRAAAVVYLASRSVPASSSADPVREIDANVRPAYEAFLRLSRLNPGAKLVFLSSGGTVYGRARLDAVPETQPLSPISPYGLGKIMCEQAIGYCAEACGQSYAILRVSNPVGRWHTNRRQGLVPAAIRKAYENAPLTVYGDGGAVRDFVDADNVAQAIVRVAMSPEIPNGIWNIGSGIGYTVNEVIGLVEKATGRKIELAFSPARKWEVDRIVLDCSKAARDLGWSATVDLPGSIDKVIRHWQQ